MVYEGKKSSLTFGQKVLGYSTRRSEHTGGGGGGGGGIGYRFRYRWAPPKGVTTRIRILPGSYLSFEADESPYFQYVEHFAARSNMGFVCSKQYQIADGEIKTVGGKCLGCKERDQGAEDISWRLMCAFNVLHLDWYHYVPAVDKNGRPIKYTKGPKEGQQAMNERLCEGRRCQYCKDGLEKFFGRHVYWSVGSGHMNDLTGIATEIEKDCKNCGGRGTVEAVSYECEECGHTFINMLETELKPDEVASFVSYKQECPKCSHKSFPMRQYECSECKDPIPLQIFDCELEIKRQGEQTSSTVQVPRWEHKDIPEELLDKCKPFTFKTIFAPDPFDVQARILKIRNPWGSEKGDPDEHSENYSDNAEF